MNASGSGVGELFRIVERRFTGPGWENAPWREIGRFTGEHITEALTYAQEQTVTFTHPAQYRVLTVEVSHALERPAEVGPLGPDDGLCRCTDSVRNVVGTCPPPEDREYGHCPKRKIQALGFERIADPHESMED